MLYFIMYVSLQRGYYYCQITFFNYLEYVSSLILSFKVSILNLINNRSMIMQVLACRNLNWRDLCEDL